MVNAREDNELQIKYSNDKVLKSNCIVEWNKEMHANKQDLLGFDFQRRSILAFCMHMNKNSRKTGI